MCYEIVSAFGCKMSGFESICVQPWKLRACIDFFLLLLGDLCWHVRQHVNRACDSRLLGHNGKLMSTHEVGWRESGSCRRKFKMASMELTNLSNHTRSLLHVLIVLRAEAAEVNTLGIKTTSLSVNDIEI